MRLASGVLSLCITDLWVPHPSLQLTKICYGGILVPVTLSNPGSPDKISNMWCYNSLKINEYNSQKLWFKIAVALIYLHSRAASNHKLDHFMKKSTYSLLLAVPFLAGVFIPPMRAWNINNNHLWHFLSLTSLDLNPLILYLTNLLKHQSPSSFEVDFRTSRSPISWNLKLNSSMGERVKPWQDNSRFLVRCPNTFINKDYVNKYLMIAKLLSSCA